MNRLLKDPIFLVGTGRCGSTVFHRMMAEHPHLAFLTSQLNECPSKPEINSVVLDWLDSPSGDHGIKRGRVIPSEAWAFWEHYVPGFSRAFRDLRADDVTVRHKEALLGALERVTTGTRTRLLLKLTGWTRIGFIKEVFPDAKVIHLIRDPRAVAASLLTTSWWNGWRGPERWRWGPLTPQEESVWHLAGRSFSVLAAIQWVKIMRTYRESLREFPECMKDDVLEIRYERLCASKEDVIHEVLCFVALERFEEHDRALCLYDMQNRNQRWRQDLTAGQQQQLEQALELLDWERYVKPDSLWSPDPESCVGRHASRAEGQLDS